MVKSHAGWRYKAPVHEYICKKDPISDSHDIMRLEKIILFQDRTVDDDKSQKRFKRDKELLYTEILKNPSDPRSYFYLSQTCGCLNLWSESYYYYTLRTKMIGFLEEVYQSLFRLGETTSILKHPFCETLKNYIMAYSHSQRVEPLCRISEHFTKNNIKGENVSSWNLAYLFVSAASKLMYPHNQILFIDRMSYVYKRWHLLGIIGYYVGRFKEGQIGAIKALQHDITELDMNNLKFYLDKSTHQNVISNSVWKTSYDTQNDFEDKTKFNVKSLGSNYEYGLKSISLNKPISVILYLMLSEFESSGRAEPLCRLGELFEIKNMKNEVNPDYVLAYTFYSAACELKNPSEELTDYSKTRWFGLLRTSLKVNRYLESYQALKQLQLINEKVEESLITQVDRGVKGVEGLKSLFLMTPGDVMVEVTKENFESKNNSYSKIMEIYKNKLKI